MKIHTTLAALALASITTACSENGEGMLHTRVYGEPFVEAGIPASVFNDGWAVTFTRFIVVVDRIAADDVSDPGRYALDLVPASGGEGHEVATLLVPAGRQALAYRIAPGAVADGGNATDADAMMMADNGWSVFIEASATKADAAIAFAWGFDSATEYSNCEVAESVPTDGEATTRITIHADHTFYDDLDSPEPNVAFELIAASDADMDGTVTRDELLARNISAELRYQVGSQHDITNLWDFLRAQTGALGHIDGEGHCES
jgi:hypothetical protein